MYVCPLHHAIYVWYHAIVYICISTSINIRHYLMSLHKNCITVMHFIGIVGEVEDNGEEKSYFMWVHKKFDIGYSDNQVCHSVLLLLCVYMCIHTCVCTYMRTYTVCTCVLIIIMHISVRMHIHLYMYVLLYI